MPAFFAFFGFGHDKRKSPFTYYYFTILGILNDDHLWQLAKRITNIPELRDLGLNILKLPTYTVEAALYNEKKIQDAAFKLLQNWYDNQENKEQAYRNLYKQLVFNGQNLLAHELMEGSVTIICRNR